MKKAILSAALLAAVSTPAMAEDTSYAGIGFGGTAWDLDGSSDVEALGYVLDDEAGGFKAFIGKSHSENFAIEGYYTYMGEIEAVHCCAYGITANAGAAGAALVGKLPINDAVSVYAKLGGHYYAGEVATVGYAETVSGVGAMLGAGVQVEGEKFFARLEAESYGLGDTSVSMTSASVGFKF